ncbi:uncharacterized protein CPUR_01624 [Claviceps purpurea 20.1]|uniref:Uncharacterized protein n=1 Tax=Claviceps purpurea (strain 20.1) TaxID=1111077 RepID=M1W333_CLAP2|nr:uncharacterized protein CPUR_01624 [Claviceps purpurea 20.1]
MSSLELAPLTFCTIMYWAVHTDDLDDTDELADLLEDALLAFLLIKKMEAENNQAISERQNLRESNSVWRGAHTPHVNKAHKKMRELLAAPDEYFRNICRVRQDAFKKLVFWLRTNTTARNTRFRLELKLMVFLYMLGHGATQRNAAMFFHMGQASVHRVFHELRRAMVHLHKAYVVQPDRSYVSDKLLSHRKYDPFVGAIGAIDGTHFEAFIPVKDQEKFWNRKGKVTQNVLAACTLDGLFTYVMAGAEGSFNDSALLAQACSRSLKVPDGRYYLADAGFGSNRVGFLTPVPGQVRYHLQEFGRHDLRPANADELYNLRHSSLRMIIEQVFGRLKRRWRITRSGPPEYSFRDQIAIIYIVTALQNFIALQGQLPDEAWRDAIARDSAREARRRARHRERADRKCTGMRGRDLRDVIKKQVWVDYRNVLAKRAMNGI